MSDQEKGVPAVGFFAQLFARWREQRELSRLPEGELDRLAGELGLSSEELAALAAKGPHASDLLYERMQALGVSRAEVDRLGSGLMREFELSCARCGDKRQCKSDLDDHPSDGAWKSYCPNAVPLEAVRRIRGRGVV